MNSIKRILAIVLALTMTIVMLTGVAGAEASKGKILYMSNLNSGIQYEFYVAYFTMMCDNLGYKFEVVYGDGFNDPAGNLAAVKNAYTSDVVALIACQDGGLVNIMDEYPDLYLAGFMSDFDNVYNEGASSADVLKRDHFLGVMGDNYISGVSLGEAYAKEVIERGFTRVSTCIFPAFAYPKHTVADAAFRAYIDKHNETAETKIEVIGEATVLQFQPLSDNYFFEAGNDTLECIVGFCAGTTFIYPVVLAAKANGICPENLKIITGGFDNDPDLLNDCGDDKNIIRLTIASVESAIWPLAMVDAALSGKMYADYTGPEQLDSGIYVINSTEEFQAMTNNSPIGLKLDLSKAQASWDDMKDYFISVNENASYKDMSAFCQSFTVEGYMK